MEDVRKRLNEYRKTHSTLLREKPADSNSVTGDSETQGTISNSSQPNVATNNPSGWLSVLSQNETFVNTSHFLQRNWWILSLLKFVLWLILLGIFVEIQFGSVFFVFSLFYVVFANLRTGPKQPGEKSAYSVFNDNCERLPGQMTAEQFENEIRRGY